MENTRLLRNLTMAVKAGPPEKPARGAGRALIPPGHLDMPLPPQLQKDAIYMQNHGYGPDGSRKSTVNASTLKNQRLTVSDNLNHT